MLSTLAARMRETWHLMVLTAVAVVATAAILAAFFWPITDLIAAHDVGAVVGASRAYHLQTARDAARGRLIQVGAGLFFAAALVFTARSYTLSRRTFELSLQGHVTDRYTQAIKQLGSGKLNVRIGGIFALERIAFDSARDHPTVTEVLTTFVREHSRKRSAPQSDEPDDEAPESAPRQDIQAAITVIGRRDVAHDTRRVNLAGAHLCNTNLAGADLAGANLARANLLGANLAGANLIDSEFRSADLSKADLSKADLKRTNLSSANLAEAILPGSDLTCATARTTNFTGAKLASAFLTGASLIGSNLTGADLSGAHAATADLSRVKLTRANLTGADLSGANLSDADLSDADLTDINLMEAELAGAWLPPNATVPDGWACPPGSVRLARIGINTSPTTPPSAPSGQ